MKKLAMLSMLIGAISVTAAVGQTSEPSYKADPDVYKVVFENADFRVIVGTRKAGQKDKPHAHQIPGVFYNVTDCKNKLYEANGSTRLGDNKAGTAMAIPLTKSHQTENLTDKDCVQVFIEKKQ
jgi:hypothetical protein